MKTNPNDPATEIWLPVKGYEGEYEVSSLGRVRSLDRYMNNRSGRQSLKKGRILKGRKINSGSVMVNLTVDRRVREVLLHRLVAEHFLPDFAPNLQVIHKDRDRSNNAASNLIIGGPISVQNEQSALSQSGCNFPYVSKREHFAAMAMQGLLASAFINPADPSIEKALPELAVSYADALIAQLNREETSTTN